MVILLVLLLGVLFCLYVIFDSAPEVNLVVKLKDETKLLQLQKILKANGIESFLKTIPGYGAGSGNELVMVEPASLHVVKIEELGRAKKLVAANLIEIPSKKENRIKKNRGS